MRTIADVRVAKGIRYRGIRARLMLDIGNLTNASPVLLQQNNTFGAK